ncbi:pyruvate kinase [Acanthopleuribacter pedis]|uniref:Pyruvate kinase n=1 Tax=Acanthopleuribacter pedis TaxID=442870 RepID=A0A8J7Q976_9BACT|nr:pyruvate kinase [Acanthopleuribacter pedis]MBO1320926.1 pyruvate kinase [Acanthopleuribacter pedis]
MAGVTPYKWKRKTKIVCTLGPAVNNREKLKELMLAGMDLARINCSHGEPEDRAALAALVREVSAELGLFLPIMFDLQGPKIRLGRLDEPIQLVAGQTLRITTGSGVGSPDLLFTTYEYFAEDVKPGEMVLIDDGKIGLRVESIDDKLVTATVVVPGLLKQRKGINLPDTKITAPSLSEKDLADLKMAVDLQVDFVAVSFVRHAQDMIHVRESADGFGKNHLFLIAKIERPEAIEELIPIIGHSDGVMVARGDLGVEIGSERVPLLQKEIIMRANMSGKFVITATQMLESMIEIPVPTRAEASDVANAILDGTDACMLSAETAAGAYPIEAVEMMSKIASEAESHAVYRYQAPTMPKGSIHHIPDGVSTAAFHTAGLMGARLLVAFTNSGYSALKLSKKHPDTFIVGATIHEHIARRMRAFWGIIPILLKKPATIEEMFGEVEARITELGLVRSGDVAILTAGYPLWTSGSTNLLRVIEIGSDRR